MAQGRNDDNIKWMQSARERLGKVSSSFCSAKWLQTTLYLSNGQTHSCHHPALHKIPAESLKNNPAALHNTSTKLQARRQMLKGERPSECQYCWNIEDLGSDHFSDRIYKSADPHWAWPHLEDVIAGGEGSDTIPTYLEVAFENTCNLKCAYCTPDVSSKWMEEIKEFGPYPNSRHTGDLGFLQSSGRMPIPRTADNPYVTAFWEWWPKIYPKLRTFRLTGGEPLLSNHVWSCLDAIAENPRADLHLAINSNLQAPEKLISRLVDVSNRLAGKVASFEIFTSCEAKGEAAEYARFGLQYPLFMENVNRLLRSTPDSVRVSFMTTFNALSITTFLPFVEEVLDLREKYNKNPSWNRVQLSISYLRWPPFLAVHVLPEKVRLKYAAEFEAFALRFASEDNLHIDNTRRLYLEEVDQLRRLAAWLRSGDPAAEVGRDREDFRRFIHEYDRRRGTNFKKIFPELTPMLNEPGFFREWSRKLGLGK